MTNGTIVKVDEGDYGYLSKFKWYTSNEYPATRINGKPVYMHRLLVKTKEGEVVDHINNNIYDNRRNNLRATTNKNNIRKSKLHSRNTSGYRGVSRYKDKWRAYTVVDGKQIHIGIFSTKEQAARAYNEKALELYGEFSVLNDIQGEGQGAR